MAAAIGAAALAPALGTFNPLGRWRAAGCAGAALIAGVLAGCWFVLPQSRSVLPVRLAISTVVIALGMGIGVPGQPRVAHRPPRRRVALAIAALACLLEITTLWRWGADLET